MFKKFVLVITTLVVLFAFVIYQPKKVDAFVSTSAKFVAQQVLKAVTKTSVDTTISKMLVDEVLDEVKKDYAVKNGFKLIENGGQKVLVKSSLDSAEKKLLKDEIDDVIEKQVYGNAPKWVVYSDWFIGVGAVIMVGQLLYATVTGDFGSYISDLITEAMTNLGWLTPAPKIVDGKEPSPDPVTFPQRSEPQYEEIGPITSFSQFVTQRTTPTNQELTMRSLSVPVSNFVFSAEMTSQTIPNGSVMGYFTGLYLHSNDGSFYYSREVSPFSIQSLNVDKRINIYSMALGRQVTIKYGNTTLYDGVMKHHPTYIDLPSSFNFRLYNKVVYQPLGVDADTGLSITRYFLISTLGLQPTLSYVATKNSLDGTTGRITEATAKVYIPYDTSNNPNTLRLGVFSSLDLAWSADALPKPTINQKYFGTPIIDPSNNKLAIPQKSILPDGYTYDPSKQEIKSPDGQVVTDPSTIPQFNPDPVVTPSPDGNVVIDGEGTDLPVPPGGIAPPSDGGGTDDGFGTGDPTEINWDKLKAVPMILTKKFPFSLPWDAQRFMQGVFGEVPSAEEFSLKIDELMGVDFNLNITMPEYFDGWFAFSRTATVILFDIGLIYALYRLLGGAS